MQKILSILTALAFVCLAGSAFSVHIIDFEADTYAVGAVAGQDGWIEIVNTGGTAAIIHSNNGPSLAGNQCLELSNAYGDIRLEKSVADVVQLEGPIVTLTYDVQLITNRMDLDGIEGGGNTIFRVRGYDADNDVAAVGNMHYDGGGGPASQVFASSTPDGLTGGWAPGGPAWRDREWHTVSLKLDYLNNDFISLTFDGVEYMQNGWYFRDWNDDGTGIADSFDLLRLWNQAYGDDGADNWRIDNIIIQGEEIPEPGTLAMMGFGLLSLLAYRRRK
jgi:hypothetical protein